jgi:Tol biopolymer transport system component
MLDNTGSASVSPDGAPFAFYRSDREQQTDDIWILGANGQDPRKIRASKLRSGYPPPTWSSNEHRLFYCRDGRGIERCDLRGEKVTTVFPSEERYFMWSFCLAPDERIIILMHE